MSEVQKPEGRNLCFLHLRRKKEFEGRANEGRITVQCRLFQRGPGWYTQQSWVVDEGDILREQMVLKRPDDSDVVVHRAYKRLALPNTSYATAVDGQQLRLQNENYEGAQWNKSVISVLGLSAVGLITWFVILRKAGPPANDK